MQEQHLSSQMMLSSGNSDRSINFSPQITQQFLTGHEESGMEILSYFRRGGLVPQ
jgi:cytochrome c oxidase assembly factor CtaG